VPGASRLLRDLLCLLGVAALCWLYHVFARVMPTTGLAAVWVSLATLIGMALLHRARIRRRAFLAVYVAETSALQHWLRGGVLLALRPLLLGLLLGLLLMIALARSDSPWTWAGLILSGPALVLLRAWWLARLAGHAGALYLPLLSWRAATLPVGTVLTVALAWLALQQAYPDFSAVSLERAVWHLVDREQARSGPAEVLLQAAAAKDGLRLWLAQQLMPAPATSLVQLLGWLLVLAEEVLFVWSYLLMCHGSLLGAGTIDRSSY
jgi:hypothetical protein